MTILMKPLALIGPMGSGKSSVGKLLSNKLKYKFVDTDERITNESKMTIGEIFDSFGEKYFRNKEEKFILNLEVQPSMVLATGGGSIISSKVRALLKKNFFTIYLRSDADTLWARVGSSVHKRPLINDNNGKINLQKLLSQRSIFYSKADLVIDSKINDTKFEVVERIMMQLSKLSISVAKEL